jgi:hypothetical protein
VNTMEPEINQKTIQDVLRHFTEEIDDQFLRPGARRIQGLEARREDGTVIPVTYIPPLNRP